jgi:hypothetical protein
MCFVAGKQHHIMVDPKIHLIYNTCIVVKKGVQNGL